MQDYSKITVIPLTKLTQENAKYQWMEECDKSFHKLKTYLTTISVLDLPSSSGGLTTSYVASRVGLERILMKMIVL